MTVKVAPKFLLALQYWEGDKAPAMKLARLIADLEPGKSETADFLFSARFDCQHDEATIAYVSRKFNVHKWVSKRRGVGWPGGCNDLWLGTYEWIYRMQEAGKIPQYRGVFTFEGDGVPTRPGWIETLSSLWDSAYATKHGQISVMGDLLPTGPIHPPEHINGNLVATCDVPLMRKIIRVIDGTNAAIGWDYVHAPFFKQLGWQGTNAIRSLYNTTAEFNQERLNELRDEGTVWIHGVKNYSLQNLVRKEFISR